ncbi:MAG: HAMP domain-containing protein [Planctomycetes bacterium]|nr:HAMP domain-containing protein [Planctomycetota bacterium]MCH7632739.1 HAMP domain-containing protein [Planctomycetota bacterium]
MSRENWFRVSLARKISLLFGAAVLLTIAVTLAFPWLQMTALNEQSMLWQAKRVASAAYQAVDARRANWSEMQRRLDSHWPALARDLDLPADQRPTFVQIGQQGPGFQRDAIDRLARSRGQEYYWRIQDNGRRFRFAMAVRGSVVDAHAEALRGIIDVRLPVRQDRGMWNSVVTALAGASGAILAILVFYVVTQRLVLSPVTNLREAAEQVATGDTGVRASITSGDEFEQLARAFNDMLDHLKEAQDQQRKINRSLDIRLGELAETNVALYESNRVKNEFLANVTHELRTPLVSIIGFAELLRDAAQSRDVDVQRFGRYSDNILTSGRSLLEIINDLLDLAKIEAGKMELHISEFSIVELCGDLVDFIRPLADKRSQHINVSFAQDLAPFHNDSGKIKQILYNLLSNAVKFTPRRGTISLSVTPHDDRRVLLSVRDTGPGIDPEHRQRVFEKFHQVDASRTREHEGSGLGLAITRDLVHMLGGTIQLESKKGEGATFTVVLPTSPPPPTVRPPVRLT